MIEIQNDIKQNLKEIGLNFAEQQVFALLLKNGLLVIQDIAKEVGLPRSTVHLACESLLSKGVLQINITGKRRYFYIDSPKSLENYINQEEQAILSKKKSASIILPKLASIFALSKETEPIDIEELQGEDGFVETFYRSLSQPKNGEVLRFGGDPVKFTIARERLKKYREERTRKKIFSKLLLPESEYSADEKKDAKLKMREVRTLPKDKFNLPIQMSVWGDSLAVTVWDKGLHSIIVRNKSFADSMKQIFHVLWENAEK